MNFYTWLCNLDTGNLKKFSIWTTLVSTIYKHAKCIIHTTILSMVGSTSSCVVKVCPPFKNKILLQLYLWYVIKIIRYSVFKLKHKDSFGKSENLSKIFFREILVFVYLIMIMKAYHRAVMICSESLFFLIFFYLNYFSNCSEGLRTNLCIYL